MEQSRSANRLRCPDRQPVPESRRGEDFQVFLHVNHIVAESSFRFRTGMEMDCASSASPRTTRIPRPRRRRRL